MRPTIASYPPALLLVLFMTITGCAKKDTTTVFYYPLDKTVKDIDGNVYHTIYIQGQTWMVENLKTTRYRNGDTIAHVTDRQAWAKLKTGAYCNYANDSAMAATYGRLYNWHAVIHGDLCPPSWHVPYDYEWQALTDTLGGRDMAGGVLKETGNLHWHDNTGATNLVGFTALPGGCLDTGGIFRDIRLKGYWWSATEYTIYDAWPRSISNSDVGIFRSEMKKESGLSVRCIRDY